MTSHGLSSSCRRGDLTRCVGVMHRAERHRRLLHGDGRRTSVMSFQTALPLPVPLPSATVSCVPASMASQHCVCACVVLGYASQESKQDASVALLRRLHHPVDLPTHGTTNSQTSTIHSPKHLHRHEATRAFQE